MSTIRVIITKIPKQVSKHKIDNTQINSFINMQNSLTTAASQFPGFIESQSYWKTNNNIDSIYPIINMSLWNSELDWKYWYNSLERNQIMKFQSDLCKEVNIDICKNRVAYMDIPLL
jgi:antibiotic biosynthesis monooxygenase (ABM) superfamily enzyme